MSQPNVTDEELAAAKAAGCRDCKRDLTGEHVRMLLDPWARTLRGVQCRNCSEAEAASEEQRRTARERELNLSRLKESFDSCCTGTTREWGEPLLHFPKMSHARLGNPQWRAKCHPKILNVIEQWDLTQSMLVLGPTGVGKTSAIVARLHAELDRLSKLVQETDEKHRFDFAYTTGFELSGCRRRSQLGEESALIRHLHGKRLVIIDEVGFEAPGEELMVVVDRHYLDGGTIVMCSGLTLEAFDAKYGGALRRRIVERGLLLNAHPRVNQGQVRNVG